MNTSILKLLTIVADEALLTVLEQILTDSGASGYTVSRVEGKGRSGMRNNLWEGENVKLEVITSEQLATEIMEYLSVHLFERYAIIAYFHDVHVVRGSHFSKR